MKTLILAGGRGKRLGKFSEDVNKCMLKVAGRPLIEYSLECSAKISVEEIVMLIGYRGDEIKSVYRDHYNKIPICYVDQTEQRGVVHAIECCQEALEGHDFMLMLGDELLIRPEHQKMKRIFLKEDLFALCGVIPVEDISLVSKTYAILQNDKSGIIRLIEKPSHPPNKLMGTGNILFKSNIFDYIKDTPVNQKRREKELPDLIQCAIDDNRVVKSFELCKKYINVNSADELKAASSYFAHF